MGRAKRARESRERVHGKDQQPGFTGRRIPREHSISADERELAIAIRHDAGAGKVVIQFGAVVQWLGMTPNQARDVATKLMHHATLAEAGIVGDASIPAVANHAKP